MSQRRILRVIVADDEPLARQRIVDLLRGENDIELAAEAANGAQAVTMIRQHAPDLIFLDVQMPGMSGLDVVTLIGASMPATIFVTAFDRFALRAFELAAVDYLLKPFDDERFEQALDRARRLIELNEVEKTTQRLLQQLPAPGDSTAQESEQRHLSSITVEQRGQTRIVPTARIDYITASGPYAELHVGDKTYAVRERMQTLEERLDPTVFYRIHRSAIVRLDQIEVILRAAGGDYAVRLKSGVSLSLSRSKREELELKLRSF